MKRKRERERERESKSMGKYKFVSIFSCVHVHVCLCVCVCAQACACVSYGSYKTYTFKVPDFNIHRRDITKDSICSHSTQSACDVGKRWPMQMWHEYHTRTESSYTDGNSNAAHVTIQPNEKAKQRRHPNSFKRLSSHRNSLVNNLTHTAWANTTPLYHNNGA